VPLPTVVQPYPLGPYSLVIPSGRYWFSGSFKASHLLPGAAQEELTRGEDAEVWQALGDGERMPAELTLTGTLLAFANIEGLQVDVHDLEQALADATALHRGNADSTSREIPVDGGALVDVIPASPYHYRVSVVVYPTSAVVTVGTAATAPALGTLVTDAGDPIVTHSDDSILVVD
jgi:hypothetical protein